jgi:hypothetical protein
VYFNFTTKINSSNRKKNLQYWWEESGKYGSGLDLSKNTLLIGNSCNSNNGDFEEIIGERWRKRFLGVWQHINKLFGMSLKLGPSFLLFLIQTKVK